MKSWSSMSSAVMPPKVWSSSLYNGIAPLSDLVFALARRPAPTKGMLGMGLASGAPHRFRNSANAAIAVSTQLAIFRRVLRRGIVNLALPFWLDLIILDGAKTRKPLTKDFPIAFRKAG